MGLRLGHFEELLLIALMHLREDAYGVTIRQEIAQRIGKDVSVGSIYNALERLERKGYVSSRLGKSTPERGGRAKRYFRIEGRGIAAFRESQDNIARMTKGIGYAF